MNDNERSKATVQDLITSYEEAAAGHGRATHDGDYKAANQQYEILAIVCRELRARGRDAQMKLIELLNCPNPDVRTWAATHSLEFCPETAEPVLKEVAQSPDLTGFSAEMTLREWRKGALRFP